MEENKAQGILIWTILVVNVATLILMAALLIIGWDVISKKPGQSVGNLEKSAPSQKSSQKQVSPTQPKSDSQQLPGGGEVKGKCGDGTCDSMEKVNAKLCPADCD